MQPWCTAPTKCITTLLQRWQKLYRIEKVKYFYQAEDQNAYYGVIYEGNERSKASDVNQDYEDYI